MLPKGSPEVTQSCLEVLCFSVTKIHKITARPRKIMAKSKKRQIQKARQNL